MIRLTQETIDPSQLWKEVQHKDCGGAVVFVGTVRELTGDQVTVQLDYEAYPPMAEKIMAEIEAEVRTKWPVGDVILVHRLGRLQITDVAVAIAVSAPHREQAFDACRHAIEQVKKLVPIWKREHDPDGTIEWVHPDGGR